MEFKFEIRKSDRPAKHWLIIKREEKSDAFCLSNSDLNRLRVLIQNYLDKDKE